MDLDELRAFLAVAKTGSFLAAAQELRQPRATLRRRVNALEARAGVTLFERSHAGVELTQPGTLLANNGRALLQQAGALLTSVRESNEEPTGEIHVMLPVGTPAFGLTPLFELMHARFPKLRAKLHFSEDPLRARDDFHLALHYGVRTPKGPWTSFELASARMALVASPAYLDKRGRPETLEDLQKHNLLGWDCGEGDPQRWPCTSGETFEVEPSIVTADGCLLRRCARAGQGIALVPDCGLPDLDGTPGDLEPVLPELIGRDHHIRLVVHEALADLPKLSLVIRETQRFVSVLKGSDAAVSKLRTTVSEGRSKLFGANAAL